MNSVQKIMLQILPMIRVRSSRRLSGEQMIMGTHPFNNINLTRRLVTGFPMGTTVFRTADLGTAVRSVMREYPTAKHLSQTVVMRYLTGIRVFQTVCT